MFKSLALATSLSLSLFATTLIADGDDNNNGDEKPVCYTVEQIMGMKRCPSRCKFKTDDDKNEALSEEDCEKINKEKKKKKKKKTKKKKKRPWRENKDRKNTECKEVKKGYIACEDVVFICNHDGSATIQRRSDGGFDEDMNCKKGVLTCTLCPEQSGTY